MVKLSSHLKLIKQDDESHNSGRLDLVSFEQVGSHEQERIKKAVQTVSSGAGIIGVMHGARSWDLRPVLMYFGERGPSVLRFLGPEVSLSSAITERARAFLNKNAVINSDQEIGLYDGQLWYRRPLYDKTLASLMAEGAIPSPAICFQIATSLIEELGKLHSAGLIHGHLVPANVAIFSPTSVKLIDAGSGIFVLQATKELAIEAFPQGYNKDSFAPEAIQGSSLSYSADIFGLGITLRELFSKVRHYIKTEGVDFGGEINEHDIQAVIDFTQRMTAVNAFERPTLANVKAVIVNFGRPEFGKATTSTLVDNTQSPSNEEGAEIKKKKKRRRKRNRNRNNDIAQSPALANEVDDSFLDDVDGSMSSDTEEPESHSHVRENIVLTPPAPQNKIGGNVATANSNYSAPAMRTEPYQPTFQQPAEEISWTQDTHTQAQVKSDYRVKQPTSLPVAHILLGALAAFFVYFIWNNYQTTEPSEIDAALSRDELRMAWESRLPSRMSAVAKYALNKGPLSKSAELIIISSAQSGEDLPDVDVGLLRVAFDGRWEKDLTESDRYTALSLAMARLLRGDLPKDMAKPEDLHPGILMAIAGSFGERGTKLLEKVPATILASLPVPYGPAFKELTLQNSALSCADPAVLALSKFAIKGVTSVDDIVSYLVQAPSFNVRIRSLAQLFSQDNVQARNLMAALLAHPNVRLDEEKIVWAKESKLYQWSELESSDQLYILAGLPPAGNISAENLGKLFWHPTAVIRGDAIGRGVDKISFAHPASYLVLSSLKEAPELLDSKQTIKLIHILLGNRQAKIGDIRAWLESNPPLMLVAALLVGTSSEPVASQLDFELYRYLAANNWKPTLPELKRLIKHPLALVRVVAYRDAYQLEDKDEALQILLEGRKLEKDNDIRENIEGFIKVLMAS